MRKTLFVLIAMLTAFVAMYAQPRMPEPLPIDPNVKYGKLENGMTYYIRHNKYPEKRADFFIAQKVGSMQEEDNQAGLAHFLEHMAFNGTKHFPGRKTMLNYLESVGAKFGANVNAYTSFDETVYTLSNIPVTRQAIIDSTLLVLHDWSGYIELEDKEIDQERLIIKEEWRTRTGAQYRIWEKQLPVIFEGSKYADRLPIGKMSIVENFEYQVIKDYYKKWYRPDLQSIIIVGDIDAEKVEAQVKELFSKIPMPANAAERIYYTVPNNDAPIVSVISDKETTSSSITYYVKHDPIPAEIKQTEIGYTQNMAIHLATSMLGERLSDMSKKAESPFLGAYAYDGNFFVSKTKNALVTSATSKEGRERETAASLIREIERVKRFGFTDSELERAKANMMKYYENSYNNKDKQQNNSYTQEYINSFVNDEPIPGIEYEYDLAKKAFPIITTNVINGMMTQLITEKNNIITLTAPDKEGLVLPANEEILSTLKSVRAENIEGFMEEIITKPLISKTPTPGKVIKEEVIKDLDITVWTLSNGLRVAIKTTDYKDDEILMNGIGYGGVSLASDLDVYEAYYIGQVPYLGGIGDFNSTDLKKVLAGKTANVNFSAQSWTQGVGGRSSIKDLETLLQLTYLYFTAPRKDEATFSNMKNATVSQLKNLKADPSYAFQQGMVFAQYGYNPRVRPMSAGDAADLDYDKIISLYKEAFANPGSFAISFVGNVDKNTLKPIVETYLASLPAGNKDIMYNKVDMEARKGNYRSAFDQKMISPKTKVYNKYSANMEYNKRNLDRLSALKQILDIVYVRTIREAEGGTYGVGVGTSISRIPVGEATLTMSFDTNPEKVDVLSPMIHSELQKIVDNGPEAEDFQKVKEYMLKKYSENIKMNGYWSAITINKVFYDNDFHTSYLESIQSMTREDIQKMAKDLVSTGNFIEVIMNPLKE